ncbi:MAG TPA: hypothetical protein VF747_11530 [Blastocatellia bacterium]|jgi:hypothetical protein
MKTVEVLLDSFTRLLVLFLLLIHQVVKPPDIEVLMFRLIIIPALLVFMIACAHEAPLEDVDKASALFFQRLNDAEYETIYKDASTQFKKNQPRDTILGSLKELTAKGRVQEYRRISTSYRNEGKDRVASPVFGTTFEQAKGDVTLTFIDEGGEWKLIAFAFKQRA